MTRQEAIRLLHPDTTREALAEIECYGGFAGREKAIKVIEEACVLACEALEAQSKLVYCKNCKYWHKDEGWCDKHSHFVDSNGDFCHPWESANWKMFMEEDFCSSGERRDDE